MFVNPDYAQNQFTLVRESELLMNALVVGLPGMAFDLEVCVLRGS